MRQIWKNKVKFSTVVMFFKRYVYISRIAHCRKMLKQGSKVYYIVVGIMGIFALDKFLFLCQDTNN